MAFWGENFKLQWDIYSNFAPAKEFKAIFYCGSFYVNLWQVTFEPFYECNNSLEFACTLQRLRPPVDRPFAKFFRISIHQDEVVVADKTHFPFEFKGENRYKYTFFGKMDTEGHRKKYHLTIKVYLTLSESDGYASKPGYDPSLEQLSLDMKKLLVNAVSTDMEIQEIETDKRFYVHSYILDVRLKKFFRHYIMNRDKVHKVDISPDVLRDILTYVYTGKVHEGWPAGENEKYCTELYYVIDKFQLYEIYKYILKSEKRQQRVTKNPSFFSNCELPLKIVDGSPVNNALPIWKWIDMDFSLDMEFRVEKKAGNWLSFSLQIFSFTSFYAEVYLELVKKVKGERDEVIPFYEASFTLEPATPKDSGPILFLGCPETFGESDKTKTRFSIRCVLHVSSPIMVQQLLSLDTRPGNTSDLDMLGHLANHMDVVRKRKKGDTIKIFSKSSSSHLRGVSSSIHEGILKARLPQWWQAIGLEQYQMVPKEVRSILGPYRLETVIRYIYTGLIDSYKNDSEIKDFAIKTDFPCLLEEITRWEDSSDSFSSNDDSS